MHRYLAVAAALSGLALPAAAQTFVRPFDLTADTDRLLGDPAFLPLRGQVEGSGTETYLSNHYDYISGNRFADPFISNYRESTDITADQLAGALAYGITDDLAAGASLNWENRFINAHYSYEDIEFFAPRLARVRASGRCNYIFFCPHYVSGTSKSHRIGPDNPDFSLTWRAVDQRAAPVNVDITASYAPDLFTARDGNAQGTTGTHAAGGQQAGLRAAVSRETRSLTVLGYGEFDYHGRQDVLQPLGDGVLRDSPHPSYQAGVQTQLRVLPLVAVNSGFNYSWTPHFHSRTGYGDNTFSPQTLNEAGGTVSPYIGLQVPIWGNRLVGEFVYQHDFVGSGKTITQTTVTPLVGYYSTTITNKYASEDADVYSVRVRFLFF